MKSLIFYFHASPPIHSIPEMKSQQSSITIMINISTVYIVFIGEKNLFGPLRHVMEKTFMWSYSPAELPTTSQF